MALHSRAASPIVATSVRLLATTLWNSVPYSSANCALFLGTSVLHPHCPSRSNVQPCPAMLTAANRKGGEKSEPDPAEPPRRASPVVR